MFNRIPEELKAWRQWVVWKLEPRPNTKPTKVPYDPKGPTPANPRGMASVTDPSTWGTYDEAIAAYESGQFSGIGFVISHDDPYTFIDLDDTHGDQVAYERQLKIYREFNSYAEVSPSGSGLHIIVRGKIPQGRRRASIEIYCAERYMTMTGNVYNDAPIAERGDLLQILFNEMGGAAKEYSLQESLPQTMSDEGVIHAALSAANGDKVSTLLYGDPSTLYAKEDGSLDWSRADMALVDIIAFYSRNHEQIVRIWRNSQLGARDKANRDAYAKYMLEKCFDNQLPPIDVDGLRIQWEAMQKQGAAAPGGTATPTATSAGASERMNTDAGTMSQNGTGSSIPFPPGLIGEVAQFILDAAPRPVPQIALAGAIGLIAGITGRAYNVSGTGLNQYVLLLAPTGTGKEAIANGISKLMSAIKTSVPASTEFVGPGEIRSDAALLKWLSKYPCIISTVGEFGLRLKQMSAPNANSHETGLKRVLLDLYNKSGHGNTLNPIAYSDKEKNTEAVHSPSFTLMGESTPEEFYSALDESMVASGLLPRFLTMRYTGIRPPLSKAHITATPPFALVDKMATLTAHCLAMGNGGSVVNVALTDEAYELSDSFDKYADAQINGANTEVTRHLWNRAHVKSLKLAALCAVGINPFNPIVGINEYVWAAKIVELEVSDLLGRFEAGEIGSGVNGSSETKQLSDMKKVIAKFMSEPVEKWAKYQATTEMHRDMIIPIAGLQMRLSAVSSFRTDRMGASVAIKRAYQQLIDADIIRELPATQMQANYGRRSKAFVVMNPEAIADKK